MKKTLTTTLLLITFLLVSCNKKNVDSIDAPTTDKINLFIWSGLNTYYLWQKDVPNLADNRFRNFEELFSFFRGFSSPETVFESLRFKPGLVDRFSIIVDDYVALENSFQGISLNNGMEFGLVRYANSTTQIFGYVRYIIPNSDAEIKGISRGMIFNTVNGTQLTDTNFGNLLFGNNSVYTIGFANYNSGNPTSNSTSISLTKTELQENPIPISKVFDEGTKKIGYLLYNQFSSSFDGELNTAFADFKAKNINELIVDLRYNGGGSVQTATYLGSMITGQFNGQLYSKEVWNQKVLDAIPADRFINNFTSQIRNLDRNGNVILNQNINSLGLTKVYFIVSSSTASASELVINSLSAYIDVQLVGVKTVGKQVGSITLYDSDNLQRNGPNLNTNHTYAMQPIVLEISNKNNENHPEGFTPEISLPGIFIQENFGNLGVLGERSDPLLDRTLTLITTGAKGILHTKNQIVYEEIFNSKLATPTRNNMYVDF
ncbi:MAG: peptidase S41 [Flavobacteriia bacterium]|nr:peptidase S41 [Flavobacteriia bacterium]OIP45123.1 MAG: peptidase S41 [Flavobacteriaceae bacterium CG2_30_31_66]PIV95319.1 MAG: peptidase S41 [Flavobacteriaceae bacterium CG17_big_fil_post_rev_8_21_14_2_50_31_13]PIY13650.1 MAG: peptidase S41 [Flavobacteriaceae bacterium CG_4_10_14_3_um_filter_31_253]PIZ11789.1 MAG: peptidase S41 [Flavobacteriaceae bacterium CG_4_10_14_0_8_um_filter_31_99]PJC09016.1 MAG: peptidase S41 [Flavobacteriaceae bacterium CG_4_9_14_0_8_um_filter_31_91]